MSGPQCEPVLDHPVLSGHVITCFLPLLETRRVSIFGSARAVWSEASLQQHTAAVSGNDLYLCDLVDRRGRVSAVRLRGLRRAVKDAEKLALTAVCVQIDCSATERL